MKINPSCIVRIEFNNMLFVFSRNILPDQILFFPDWQNSKEISEFKVILFRRNR